MPATYHQPESVAASRPSGARRLNLSMLTVQDRADRFAGVPKGTAKPMHFLAAFQEAEPYLGLPTHAFKLVSWLVKQTRAQDWEEGSRPIAWPSARRQAEYLGLSPCRVKALNRALFEAGIFVIRDNPQGKRYGRRGTDGRIIEAYGFDLSPLALRCQEFVQVAATASIERDRMKALRSRVTCARRRIRQVEEELTAIERLPAAWPRLQGEAAGLVAAAREAERSDEMAIIANSLERRKSEAEQWLRDTQEAVETNPKGFENDPHTTDTNLRKNPYQDTVIASEGGKQAAPAAPPSPVSVQAATTDGSLKLTAPQLLDLAPRLARYVLPSQPNWRDLVDAAGDHLRPELGVSLSLWGEACRILGRERAAMALAIVSAKPPEQFTRGPGAYFAGMVRRAEKEQLHLERSLWALRSAKWGKPDKRLH